MQTAQPFLSEVEPFHHPDSRWSQPAPQGRGQVATRDFPTALPALTTILDCSYPIIPGPVLGSGWGPRLLEVSQLSSEA